jgi:hypothetical protein
MAAEGVQCKVFLFVWNCWFNNCNEVSSPHCSDVLFCCLVCKFLWWKAFPLMQWYVDSVS